MSHFSFASETSEQEPSALNCAAEIAVSSEPESVFKKCISKHVIHTRDWLSQATSNKRKELLGWAAAALGGGFLTDIPHLLKYATSQKDEDDPSSHLNDRVDLGTGLLNTASVLAPYVIFAGASFATTAVLVSTGQWILVGGVSYLILNKLFDAAKFSGNEVRCKKMCKVDRNNGALIANVGAAHFKNSITELKKDIRKENRYIKAFQATTPSRSPFKKITDKIETPEELLDVETLLTKFSQANSPTWEAYVKASQHCLTNCSTSSREATDFICEFLSKIDNDLEAVLYFAKLLSASHTNFFSFGTIKNTNLAKFLKNTRPPSNKGLGVRATNFLTGKLKLRESDPLKYGSPEQNSCVTSKKTQGRNMHKKIKTLIDFQIGLENAAKLKEQEMITSAYDPKSCMVCVGENLDQTCSPCGQDKSLSDQHGKCQRNVRALMEKEMEHKPINVFTSTESQKAFLSLQAAILAEKYEEKLDHYEKCLRKGDAILTLAYSDRKCSDCKSADHTSLLAAQHQRCQAVIEVLQTQNSLTLEKKSSWMPNISGVTIKKNDLEKAKQNLKDAIKATTFEARKELYRKCNKRIQDAIPVQNDDIVAKK